MNFINIKIGFYNILKNPFHSAVSILGLALGLASALLIYIYVTDELSFDEYHEKKDRIVRLSLISNFQGQMVTALSNFGAGPTLKEEYPEVENYVRFRTTGNNVQLSISDKIFNETNIWFCDSSVFDVFTYSLIEGDKEHALTAPQSIVLVESLKNKLFGTESALGKSVKVNNNMLTVTGVMMNPPKNSDLPINALISLNTWPEPVRQSFNQDWFRLGFYTFLLFNKPPNLEDFRNKLVAFEEKYTQPWAAANDLVASQEYITTPLSDVHFVAGLSYDLPKGNMQYIYTFIALAAFILLMATFNYVNISLSQSVKRAKSIGIQKTVGAKKTILLRQFLIESISLTAISAIVALVVSLVSLSLFNEITTKQYALSELFNSQHLLALLAIVLMVGLFAGFYPALVLSSKSPLDVLKGQMSTDRAGIGNLQKVLIFLQFTFSLAMIIGTFLVKDQMDYMRSMNLGFDRENIISISLPSDTNVVKQVPSWTQELRKEEGVLAIANSGIPTGGGTGELMFRIEKEGVLKEQNIKVLFVDEHFVGVMGLDILSGRNFNREINTDQTQAFIINEFAAHAFGWKDEAIGKRMQWGLMPNNQASNDGNVVGVINNFHFLSLHNPMEPLVLCYNPNGGNTLSIKLSNNGQPQTIAKIEDQWKDIAPAHDISIQFIDDLLQTNYVQESSMGKLFRYYAFISILIACLGLFSLVNYSMQSRMKEIGIRKVLGASISNIAWLLVKNYCLLLGLAFLVVAPLSYYAMQSWLENFAFAVSINWLTFILGLVVVAGLAIVTVSINIYFLKRSDPLQAIQYD